MPFVYKGKAFWVGNKRFTCPEEAQAGMQVSRSHVVSMLCKLKRSETGCISWGSEIMKWDDDKLREMAEEEQARVRAKITRILAEREKRQKGEALLVGHCTHRLGAYHG